jgi:hypothetical protein
MDPARRITAARTVGTVFNMEPPVVAEPTSYVECRIIVRLIIGDSIIGKEA